MIIVTGGAGFIGSNIIKYLNKHTYTNILVVDNLTNTKYTNLLDLKILDYMDKKDFIKNITESQNKIKNIQTIFHEGACSSTTVQHAKYMMKNNYEYSKIILHYCLTHEIPLLYASSAAIYGNQKKIFIENQKYEHPVNIYGYSKFLFDQYVRTILPKSKSQIFGGRYFNVYGPREKHKKEMASIISQIIHQINNNHPPSLFKGSENFLRDFIHIDDIVNVNMWAWKNNISGIFNIGTGISKSFTNIANIILKLYKHKQHKIRYIDFPQKLKQSYQTLTQANITYLRNAGYNKEFTNSYEGIKKYIDYLKTTEQ